MNRKRELLERLESVLDNGSPQEQMEAIEDYISSWRNSEGYIAAGIVEFYDDEKPIGDSIDSNGD